MTAGYDGQSTAPPEDNVVIQVVFSRDGNIQGKTPFEVRVESTTIEGLIRLINAFLVHSPVDHCTAMTTLQIGTKVCSIGFGYGKLLSEAGVSNGSEVTAHLPTSAAEVVVPPDPDTTEDLPTMLSHEYQGVIWEVNKCELVKHFQETISGPYVKMCPQQDDQADFITVQVPRDMMKRGNL